MISSYCWFIHLSCARFRTLGALENYYIVCRTDVHSATDSYFTFMLIKLNSQNSFSFHWKKLIYVVHQRELFLKMLFLSESILDRKPIPVVTNQKFSSLCCQREEDAIVFMYFFVKHSSVCGEINKHKKEHNAKREKICTWTNCLSWHE